MDFKEISVFCESNQIIRKNKSLQNLKLANDVLSKNNMILNKRWFLTLKTQISRVNLPIAMSIHKIQQYHWSPFNLLIKAS